MKPVHRASVALIAPWALALTLTSPAAASDDACIDAHRTVQLARRDHRLLEAKHAVSVCAQNRCPTLIGADCRAWLPELESQVPSVVFDIVLTGGQPAGAFSVEVDGERVEVPPGRSLELDPGEHRFLFRRSDGQVLVVRAVVLEGQKAQPVRAVFPAERDAAALRSGGPPLATYVLGGASLAALGVAVGFGVDGLSRRADLDDLGCRPGCDPSQVSAAQRSFLVADVSLAVGLGLAAVAAVFWIFRATPASAHEARSGPTQAGVAPLRLRF